MKIDTLSCVVLHQVFSLFDHAFLDCDFVEYIINPKPFYQGFVWRRGQVQFDTLCSFIDDHGYDSYSIDVEVLLDEPVKLDSNALRAIQVPFSVVGSDGIRISNYFESEADPPSKINIPAGDYALVFEQGWKYNPQPIEKNEVTGEDEPEIIYTLWGRLWFNLEKNAEPKILLRDPGIVDVDFAMSMDYKLG